MNRVAIGLLALLLVAGCAMEAGAPPEGIGSQPGEVAAVPAIRTTGGGPASSGTPRANPEPSPWMPNPNVNTGDDGTAASPEPSPWHEVPNAAVQGLGPTPPSGPSSGKNTGSTTSHPQRIGHWDLKDVAASQ